MKPDATPSQPAKFSPAEENILRLVCGGCLDKEIAERLGCSVSTVRTHLARAAARNKLHGRAALAVRFVLAKPDVLEPAGVNINADATNQPATR